MYMKTNPADTTEANRNQCRDAIVSTISYADIFDYPMRASEIHRYLIGCDSSPAQVQALLAQQLDAAQIEQHEGYYSLPKRIETVATRMQRAEKAQKMWPQALAYGRMLAQLPFVRMVSVTGSLAVNNVDDKADIDYFIVAADQYLWLCRAVTILLVRIAKVRGVILCPNFFVAESALTLQTESLYAARELAQMVPIYGFGLYNELLARNRWMLDYLPNALPFDAQNLPPQVSIAEPTLVNQFKRISEKLLQTRFGRWLEQWEQKRKIPRFQASSKTPEAAFSADWCKGHFDAHGERVLSHYTGKLANVEKK